LQSVLHSYILEPACSYVDFDGLQGKQQMLGPVEMCQYTHNIMHT